MKKLGAIYVRLSREDEDKIEGNHDSRSIQNQIKALMNYAHEHAIEITKIYDDDGYSGGHFNRPGFQAMLKDVYNHQWNILLIKDISRLGRVMHQVGNLIEHIFPDHHVRVISLNDHYDSENNESESIVLRNFFNSFYLKDFKKKCRKSLERRAQTKHLNYYPKYGYRFDDTKKEQIDPYSSKIVKQIFDYASEGKTTPQIAKLLNEAGILTRSHYAVEVLKMKPLHKNPSKQWNGSMIWEIIKDYEYCGHSLNLLRKEKPPILVRNTHDAIISEELFKKANDSLLSRNKKETNINHLGSILKDAITDKKMSYYSKNKEAFYYSKGCGYSMNAKVVHSLLYNEVLNLIKNCAENSNAIKELYKKRIFKTQLYDRQALEFKLTALNEVYASLIQDFFDQKITHAKFDYQSQEFVNQITNIEKQLKEYNNYEAKVTLYENKFIKFIKSLKEQPEDAIDLIKMVVSKVLISKPKGQKEIDLTIVYKCE